MTEDTSLQVWIRVDSDNLASDDSGIDSTMSVTVTYDVTLHPASGVEWRLPQVSGEQVEVVVGVLALVVLAGVIIITAPEAALVAGVVAIGAGVATQ